jgi:hypothetical protein
MQRWQVTLDGENVWSVGGKPMTFASEAEAEAELIQYLEDCSEAFEEGYMEDDGSDCDYRIVPVP